ncbi:MAG: asparaginyl/glutamyl-tRNA amidotransferase subunit C [Ignavibacteria bacterium RIFOXYB2_FULL_35_12]|nr:MAG: asparaginyl/glutamyl-tRNA amidotransferase subunit C [Ignavibacteria bacterium GWA2_36_19]OGU50804.1 MAG: asparaginyl/glutamyl-tRNA amidotransferase subunit C [Ignavibacteria bacterium GWC2_35_8]OGU61116.1 MAG: asparaginyl/glutamyl-tRNA amidotransferase subunit C [Ignavibacteria bacterium GWF2_35_20]OGU80375.1 MAG: asparaginyl/glutamyl-tRNA amidotransferase subunit C [Ignavibacteria bacterium RBG_16_35_7]OGU82448.1 MAG: asparaginyl/glutamyl-tRNA amidotransferase subunit C [Ignavibacteri
MSVTRKEIEHIAELARLQLKENELEEYTLQLNKILDYVEKLNELDTKNVKPLSHPVEGENVFREDELKPSVDREEALKNAPSKNDEFFKVPKVIGGD